ncbi:DNA-directed RNA polymerase omega subunit [Deferribacter desulfuricans SSM1]|uniref:DNA-directed RNA polymerase subunit omega n=1 Tax=Deferribacter desulfuricans (strain DSM 14783 / JCM 11476 / NBRC 101012 / SSM1) TaxID=639282 RepID=D3PE64_DEFDS|nr:DNA-directed RNA polymerase subunit omega [Deferribacter desulfuricans]BAI80887.1 DNA-directed RNA polymerase omega subunit [Deferribacter desulfuricans SSM1]
MAFLNIEKGVNREDVKSRFKLSLVASQRARELYENKEGTVPPQVEGYYKNVTIALAEIIENKITFEEEQEQDE